MSMNRFSLFKRANGLWYVSYFEDGRQRCKSTGEKLKTNALQILNDFQNHLDKKLPTILLSEFIKQFELVQSASIRPNTLKSYKLSANNFLRICGNKFLTAYTLRDVETFKVKRLEPLPDGRPGCTPTTVNIEFRSLKTMFNLAVKWELLHENPFLKSHQVKMSQQLPIYMTKDEFKGLIKAVNEPVLKDVFLFAACTGLRLGEILNLKWKDVDLERKQIAIVNSETFKTKSGRCRIIPMNDLVYDMLFRRSYIVNEFVFHKNGYQLQVSYVSHKFKKYIKHLNLSEKIHFHSLRHTFATWLVQDGVSIYEVQKLLGHSSVKVTEVYSHLAANELHKVVNRISITLN